MWVELNDDRYDEVWDRFEQAFAFNPSTSAKDWPTFLEPQNSLTWDINNLLNEFYPWSDSRATPYNLALLDALKLFVAEDECVVALDWQHAAYEFYPHKFRSADCPDDWCIPALPSAEYHIFITEDHRLGSLGHPWEQTLCIFGDDFLETYRKLSPLPDERIIRKAGQKLFWKR